MEATPSICNALNCTLSQTGKCILDNDPITCADRLASLNDKSVTISDLNGDAVLSTPEDFERLSASLTMSMSAVIKLMQNRYCKIIGILGIPDAGKTASLVSLYLLLAHNKLEGFRFKDSKSIMAFEEICRGARRWDGNNLPEQLTVHTELKDERTAGFLHLRLENLSTNQVTDLLLTDLPGEWTTSLIDNNRIDRLAFLQRADRIILALNAEELVEAASRKHAVHRMKLLIERLEAFIKPNMPPVYIVLTHCDKTGPVKHHLSSLEIVFKGFKVKACEIASFSSTNDIKPGTGIAELISELVGGNEQSNGEFWPTSSYSDNTRNMLRFGINK